MCPARDGGRVPGTWLGRQHDGVRRTLKLPADFVLHSLRHSMLTRRGEAGADDFTIEEIAGHSSIVISQRAGKKAPTKVFTKAKKMTAVKSS